MTSLLLVIIYLAFISLGLPDALPGAAWPAMYTQFDVPLSYVGILSAIISIGTVVSSLMSDRINRVIGTGKITVISVGMTAAALLGFSFSNRFRLLCIWAIPYGLGAGSVDASLNNYVAIHYESRHMSWLHCMWGIGAAIGPYIISYALTGSRSWNAGYRYLGILQVGLTAILLLSLPLWKSRKEGLNQALASGGEIASEAASSDHALSLGEIVRLPGAKEILLCFFCYSSLQRTTGLWLSSYLSLEKGMTAEAAAALASLFYIGITIGRAVSGFVTIKFDDKTMVRMGQVIVAAGTAAFLIPGAKATALAGFILIGLGCAPIYPCLIHATPLYFGADKSQAVIGVQMACGFAGTCIMPPLFGLIANGITVALFPVYLLALLVLMVFMHERLLKRVRCVSVSG